MMSNNACLLALLLATVYSVLSAPFHVGSASSSSSRSQDSHRVRSDMLSVENEYLVYLYRTIEESGKPASDNGEVNLLPEDTKHFANMVECVPPVDSEDSEEVTVSEAVQRTVTYNLLHNFISSTQKLVLYRLVIPPTPCSSLYQINAYSSTDPETPQDSGSSRDKYMDLNMELFNHLPLETDTIYKVILEITSPDGSIDDDELAEILKSLKPILVMFSYDSDLLKNLFQAPDTNALNKREAPLEMTGPTLEERKQEFCQVHTVNLTTFDPWISPNFEVVNPDFPSMSFCYGHCRIDGQEENTKQITRHAQFVGRMNPNLITEEISPCCIPISYGLTKLEFKPRNSSNVIMTVIQNHATSCRCY